MLLSCGARLCVYVSVCVCVLMRWERKNLLNKIYGGKNIQNIWRESESVSEFVELNSWMGM